MEHIYRDPIDDESALEPELIITTALVSEELTYRWAIEPFVGHPSIMADFNELAITGLAEAEEIVRRGRMGLMSFKMGEQRPGVRAAVVIVRPSSDRSSLDSLTDEQRRLAARIGERHRFAAEDMKRIEAEEAARLERDRLAEEAAHEARLKLIAIETAQMEVDAIKARRDDRQAALDAAVANVDPDGVLLDGSLEQAHLAAMELSMTQTDLARAVNELLELGVSATIDEPRAPSWDWFDSQEVMMAARSLASATRLAESQAADARDADDAPDTDPPPPTDSKE